MTIQNATTLPLNELAVIHVHETIAAISENNRLRNIAQVVGDNNGLLKIMQQRSSLLSTLAYWKGQIA